MGIFVVLPDLNMPVMNGWEFLKCCKTKSYADRIFVVIVTSSTGKSDLTKALGYKQVIAFFNKPFNIENIKAIQSLKEVQALWKSGGDEKEGSMKHQTSYKVD